MVEEVGSWDQRPATGVSPATSHEQKIEGADVRRRPNLRVLAGALATGLVFDGRRATGVTVKTGGEEKNFFQRRGRCPIRRPCE